MTATDKYTFKIHMTAAIILVIVQIFACLLFDDFGIPIIFMLITNIAYTAWISSERGYAPWPLCFGFIALQGLQFMLNETGVIPEHGDIFCTDLGQFCYCAGLLLTAVVFIVSNFIRWVGYLAR